MWHNGIRLLIDLWDHTSTREQRFLSQQNGGILVKTALSEQRTIGQLKEHYEVEKELAGRLRTAGKQERQRLYASLYDQLYLRVPHHPQNTRKTDPVARQKVHAGQMKLLQRFIRPNTTFMEIGPGDCSLSIEMARHVEKVFAVDVSKEITKSKNFPPNFQLFLSDGSSIPVPVGSVNAAYSYQLMEHLHPDDAVDQIRNIYEALVPGGHYVCITPNRFAGPHDISKYFDEVATGFHLKEYLTFELANIFNKLGFSKVRAAVGIRGLYLFVPVFPIRWLEISMMLFPVKLRRQIAKVFPFRSLLGINLVVQK
jgi:SAM-dependent methyltransferase